MKLKTLSYKTIPVAMALFVTCSFAWQASASEMDDIINAFLSQVEQSTTLNNEQKSAVRSTVEQLRDDEYGRDQAISSGLLVLYPEYEEAVLLADDDVSSAETKLNALMESEDKFLAADATFYLARTLMGEERHEDAIGLLEKLNDEFASFTLHSGNALYFAGVAQANLLQNQQAIKTFDKFLKENPKAPERLKVSAWRQMEMLTAIEEGSLSDVFQRMDFSRRRLELEKTDDLTQDQQDKIVKMLNKLIKQEEKKECSSCSSSKNCDKEGEQPKDGQAQNPGKGKSNKGGTSNQENGVARRSYDNGPASPWSRLRNRNRDPANTAVKERLPARYRKVVEKYNESVNETDSSNNN